MTHDIRKFMKLMEQATGTLNELDLTPSDPKIATGTLARDTHGRAMHPGITMEPSKGKVTAKLSSYNSQSYTKLAQKVLRAKELAAEVKQLEEEIKQETREDIADLFSATDIVYTRVVETVSFVMTLSKNPEASTTYKYAEILKELTEELTPELISKLEVIKKKYQGTSQRSPSLSITAKEGVNEGIFSKFRDFFARFLDAIRSWGQSYDARLGQLKAMAAGAGLTESDEGGDDVYPDGEGGGDDVMEADDVDPEAAKAQYPNSRFTDGDGNVVLSLNEEFMDDEVWDDATSYLNALGYDKDVDYEWAVAMGDTNPHAIVISNKAMVNDDRAMEYLTQFEGENIYDPGEGDDEVEESAPIAEADKFVNELQGFVVGDTIMYTATEESPPATYQGKILKLIDTGAPGYGKAQVEWLNAQPKKVHMEVDLHWCRTMAQANAPAQHPEENVGESVDYSRIDRIEKQVEHMVRSGRSRAYIIANIGEKMGPEEADYAGDYFDEYHKDHVGTEMPMESASPKKSEVKSLYGHQYIKEDEDEAGDDEDEGDDTDVSEDDIQTDDDKMMTEFTASMGEPMAYSQGSTVYCGGREGTLVGTVPGKPDVWLVELPNGDHDAFPKGTTTTEKPSFFKKAFHAIVGEDQEGMDNGDVTTAEYEAAVRELSKNKYMTSDRAVSYMVNKMTGKEVSDLQARAWCDKNLTAYPSTAGYDYTIPDRLKAPKAK